MNASQTTPGPMAQTAQRGMRRSVTASANAPASGTRRMARAVAWSATGQALLRRVLARLGGFAPPKRHPSRHAPLKRRSSALTAVGCCGLATTRPPRRLRRGAVPTSWGPCLGGFAPPKRHQSRHAPLKRRSSALTAVGCCGLATTRPPRRLRRGAVPTSWGPCLGGFAPPPETTPVKARAAYASLFGLDSCRVLRPGHNTPPTAPEERRRPHFVGPLQGGVRPPDTTPAKAGAA